MKVWRRGLVLASLLLAPILHADELQTILARFGTAEHALSYRLTWVVSDARPPQVLERVHRAGQQQSTMELLSGAGTATLPLPSLPDAQPESAQRLMWLQRSYRLQARPREMVARRVVLPVWFQPNDGLRYATLLWLDVETGVPLKTQVHDSDGRILEYSVATELELLSDSAPAISAPVTVSAQGSWRIDPMPPGFQQVAVHRNGAREQLFLLDGLATISIFVEAADGRRTGAMRRGAMSSLIREQHGARLTAVGGVPLVTLERVLNAAIPTGCSGGAC
ncbi:MAG: MucB/RseB C-terminal domain-containing protein [Xanthomonadales bacterium]|nr:MucB/RseB C-terminal domain-containing protein [Xanthomonadales bacterium]